MLVFRNTDTIRLHREIIETDWNMMKIDLIQMFQLFRNKWN